ncbi:metalloregulator ArsR/SmtB family transcription factor [Demequina sp.]|uniref:ArsR/SmtB family transcription factor n=1 Tax=Demequina sp. TaxID=2050685 RepID=UPI0025E19453|nr:metalloregulator ArsR/SmtB family transcription factor [Demequina sp.]
MTAGVVSDASAESLAGVFKALGAPTRVKLLSMVAAAPGAEACICDMTAPVGLSQPTVSHHMRLLVEAGLVTREQRGRWAHFRIVPGALAAVAFALQPAGSATRES